MSSVPHPLTLEDRALNGNRWRARRVLWAQTVFVGTMYAALATALVLWWLDADVAWLPQALAALQRHAAMLAVLGLLVGAAMTRQALHRDALRHNASAYAALPIQREMQQRRDWRVRAGLVAGWSGAAAVLGIALALRDGAAALAAAESLRWSLVAAVLATVMVPAPAWTPRVSEERTRSARVASTPRALVWLSVAALPHLPEWWWQRAGQTWMRGRATGVLAVGLALAPTEAAAIIVPITLLLFGALLNGLDVAHRLAGDVERLLAARPPAATQVWRALLPLHAVLAIAIAACVGSMMLAIGVPTVLMLALVAMWLIAASIDLLLAIRLRQAPQRLTLARTQLLLVTIAIASGLPLLLPVLAIAVLWVLARQLRADAAHA